jgi:hypothetical protein
MNSFVVSFHLAGNLPPTHELVTMFGQEIKITRRGEIAWNGEPHEHDRVFLRLATWDAEPQDESKESIKHCEEIATMIKAMTPTLEKFKDAEVKKWLRLGTVRRADTGGFTFPLELVQTLAEAGMYLYISMTVILDDDRDDGGDEPYDDDPISDPDVGVVVS